jgi:hypothetical protein
MSAIRLSVVKNILDPKREKSFLNLTGVDDKKVMVDSLCSLKVKWENKVVELNEVAVVKNCPFALILGVDWIVKSKLSLIVEDGKIVLKSQDSNQPKVKKVRFAGIEEQNICSEEDDENDFFCV